MVMVQEDRDILGFFLSIAFPGIGVAEDWYAFEELVFELEEVQDIKRELEEVTGPLEQTVLWDI
jgi:hypothetical protein